MVIEPTTQIQMPRYKCHKEVWALKIADIVDPTQEGCDDDGTRVLEFEETNYHAIRVPAAWFRKHDPKVGGYFVTYDDGYTSFSPAKAFEEGYTLLT